MRNLTVISVFMLISSLVFISCSSLPLTESDNYLNVKGDWLLIGNTYGDAPWPDSRYVFSDEGFLYIYHEHMGEEYLAGTFKLFTFSSTKFRSRFYEVGECNALYDNSDWAGNGTVMYNWYELKDGNKMKLGWTSPKGVPHDTGYLVFEKD